MNMKKTKLALGVATAVAALSVAPQAAATDVQQLESKVEQMAEMLRAMQDELNAVKSSANRADPQVQELNDWMAAEKSKPVKADTRDNMVFFRGGYAHMDNNRPGVSIDSVVSPASAGFGTGERANQDGWYIGAGFDFSLNDNLFGLMDGTEILAELMFEYKQFADDVQGNALANSPTMLVGAASNPLNVTVSQFTLTAAPKIKFMKGSSFRPWVIPFGLAMHVISPPSESITVFNPGVMFGAGVDYNLWEDIYVGLDARYHLTGHSSDGVNTDGLTAGGYLGIGF